MKKVIILQGLPASGKSTWARQQIDINPGMYKRVNKDELRYMLDNGKWSKDNEKFILNLRDHIIIESLEYGKHVIVDDTNLHERHLIRIKDLVTGYNKRTGEQVQVIIEDKFLDISLEECIRRDAERENSVGRKVIEDMYNNFIKVKEIPTIQYNDKLPDCVIFDIDNTLAVKGKRSAYDWDKVDQDQVNIPVYMLYEAILKTPNLNIIIMSGRDSVCRDKTEEWLKKYGIRYDALFMRAEGDMRKDLVIKKELYEQNIKDKYNVRFIVDDRKQVVDMWRSLGLIVFQVAEGNF